uniref:F-box domain-containing protein n=1 Tax=Oryza glumipatula TaxID=40148 RepID=A0A0E0A460_9ORYZ
MENTCKRISNTPNSMPVLQGWADLPDDLLQCVLALLSSPSDLAAFIATCPNWHAAFRSAKSTLRTTLFRPLAIRSCASSGDDPVVWELFDPAKPTICIHRVTPPDFLAGMDYECCSYGHAIFSGNAPSLKDTTFAIVDVFTGTSVSPPPCPFFTFVNSCALTAPLDYHNSHFLVEAKHSLFAWRVGSDHWSQCSCPPNSKALEQFVPFKGQLYALEYQQLYTVKLEPQLSLEEVQVVWSVEMSEPDLCEPSLVVCDDMLILLAASIGEAFRLDLSSQPAMWVKMEEEELKEWAFFFDEKREAFRPRPPLSCKNPQRWGGIGYDSYSWFFQREKAFSGFQLFQLAENMHVQRHMLLYSWIHEDDFDGPEAFQDQMDDEVSYAAHKSQPVSVPTCQYLCFDFLTHPNSFSPHHRAPAMAPYPLPPPSPPQQQLPPASSSKPRRPPPHRSHGGYKNGTVSVDSGAPHDARGLRALIKALAAEHGEAAPAVHAHAAKLGLDRRRAVRDGLVELYLARGELASARALVDGFPAGRDVVSCTAMVTGHARHGFLDEAVVLFFAMADDRGVAIDAVAAAAAFSACAQIGDLALGREAHRRVAERKVAMDVVAWNALVDMYAKCGDAAAAHRWFRRMPVKKNVVSWNTMMSAFARAGELEEALALFQEMQAAAVRPDDATFVAALGACAQLGALDTGRWLHAYMGRMGHSADGVVGNALLDMYAKCGAVDQATEVFDGMVRRDVYTYTSMILGLAMHGRGEDALSLFAGMQRAGVTPNEVTLLGVLTACCHAGLVEEGLRQLNAMPEPRIEHYGCVVDMLGRAGRLDEAEELIAAMPVHSDALIWGSLLAACRAHGDVERAERVMRRRVADADAGDYVLMSNTYASNGRHGEAVKVRGQMRRNEIDKVPGCSLIEIDGVVHEFKAIPANSIR